MSQDEQVLDLSALTPERQQARLRTKGNPEGLRADGTLYEIRTPEEMSARELRTIGNDITEMLGLWETASSKTDDAKLTKLLNGIAAQLVVDAPEAAVKTLPPMVKRGLGMGFLARSGELMTGVVGAETLARFASASSLPASNGSTGETP